MVPPVDILNRRAASGGRVAGSGCGLSTSSCAHGRSSRLRIARRDRAFAFRFGVAVGQCVAFLVSCEHSDYVRLHPAARVGRTVPRVSQFAGELGPNRAVNTDAPRARLRPRRGSPVTLVR